MDPILCFGSRLIFPKCFPKARESDHNPSGPPLHVALRCKRVVAQLRTTAVSVTFSRSGVTLRRTLGRMDGGGGGGSTTKVTIFLNAFPAMQMNRKYFIHVINANPL